MLLGVLLPTIINVSIFLSAGIMRIVPKEWREKFALECDKGEFSRFEADRLAWRISAMDLLTGVIFFAATLLCLAYVLTWLAPAIGELLYSLAKIRFA